MIIASPSDRPAAIPALYFHWLPAAATGHLTPVMTYPEMLTIRRRFDAPREAPPEQAVPRELEKLDLVNRLPAGASIAVPVGSRGIRGIAAIIASVVRTLTGMGLRPFLVPAMGSHGGGTTPGQLEVLHALGITEEATGAPIRASMETVVVGETARGLPVHVDRHAAEADAILIVNRVKPHTEFRGAVESGLLKMMLIGLGKLEGAALYHRAAVQNGFADLAREAVPVVIGKARVVGGLAILENAREETARLTAVNVEEIFEREAELLEEAIGLMARLPFPSADVLLVDRMGKNISGVGVDPNVTGRGSLDRWERRQSLRPPAAEVTRLIVRSLTPETGGNALGIGLVDFIPRSLAEAIDWPKTHLNAITALVPYKGRCPIVLANDRECLETALTTCGLIEPEAARIMHIADTMHLEILRVSRAYADEVEQRGDLELLSRGEALRFDKKGNLIEPVTDLLLHLPTGEPGGTS